MRGHFGLLFSLTLLPLLQSAVSFHLQQTHTHTHTHTGLVKIIKVIKRHTTNMNQNRSDKRAERRDRRGMEREREGQRRGTEREIETERGDARDRGRNVEE